MMKLILLVSLISLGYADPLTEQIRQEIIDNHNRHRGSVVPSAANMMKMVSNMNSVFLRKFDFHLEKKYNPLVTTYW